MSHNSSDLRVRRTQKLLREALIALIEERGFDAITVGELASRAMVSRAAFYRYYQDKYDLAEQLFEETMHTLVTNFDPLRRELLHSSAPEPTSEFWMKLLEQLAHSISPPEAWVRLFELVAEHERLYRALLDQKRSSWFVTKMRTSLAEVISTRHQVIQHIACLLMDLCLPCWPGRCLMASSGGLSRANRTFPARQQPTVLA
jgi:AcrR family transcriptional regulator